MIYPSVLATIKVRNIWELGEFSKSSKISESDLSVWRIVFDGLSLTYCLALCLGLASRLCLSASRNILSLLVLRYEGPSLGMLKLLHSQRPDVIEEGDHLWLQNFRDFQGSPIYFYLDCSSSLSNRLHGFFSQTLVFENGMAVFYLVCTGFEHGQLCSVLKSWPTIIIPIPFLDLQYHFYLWTSTRKSLSYDFEFLNIKAIF